MKTTPVRGLLLAGAICALAIGAQAQVIELRATINAAQEVPTNSSPATGSAIMLYDVGANTYDLIVSVSGFANTLTDVQLFDAAAGANAAAGSELARFALTSFLRTGNTITASIRGLAFTGNRLRLLQGNTYLNFHSNQFPNGEVRGQLIATPVRLVANLDLAQEVAAFPALNFAGVTNFGGAVLIYNPTANTISIRHSLFNFLNVFTNSHIHTGAPGISGPVNTALGTNATAGAYNSNNGHISGTHNAVAFAGDPIVLLTGGMYLNYHSAVFGNGQLRGQISVSSETASTRMGNLSTRGFVGTGDQVLIGGISIQGTEPVRVLVTAKGPSLTAFGVVGALANPRLALFDSAGRQIATNDDIGPIASDSDLVGIPGVPTNPLESALVVVLPPGNYTAIVSAATGTGVALVEAYDLRNLSRTSTIVSVEPPRAASPTQGLASAAARGLIELCAALPLGTATAVAVR